MRDIEDMDTREALGQHRGTTAHEHAACLNELAGAPVVDGTALAAFRTKDGQCRGSLRTVSADLAKDLRPERMVAATGKGARYSDAELRAAPVAFAAEHHGPVGSRDWDAWATRASGRPRFAVLVRRLQPHTIATVTGITIGPRRVPHREMETRRQAARATLVELAVVLGRTPQRVELDPSR